MKKVQHLTPILNTAFQGKVFLLSRVNGRELFLLKLCAKLLPELEWDFLLDFPFNPKSISKVKDRRLRKACYQSFAQYKKTFKPRPIPKLKIIKDEWPSLEEWKASMLEATKTAVKKFSDTADAMAYAFHSSNYFKSQYSCAWDLAVIEE
ncbi:MULTISPECIES: hypothetical protein [Acinetobacter calcoaceticus/baumannii complex]|uniref:hypothetical protein n=1 Tax=Acinetobacter calcoaceticus/baumannii complex TaxID=909768 RepID=UPI00070F54DC|nr:hypothetical protein [Acinetobacter baumannii]KRI03938.1 hypothetical protein APC85_13840 [Acinetobacter baumannii]KRI08193.1 hypothetical protein APC63_04410 [Acinetobacter baumannii]KRI73884.1 hypothetical protein APC65_00505 [Acinetobacter baumannii]